MSSEVRERGKLNRLRPKVGETQIQFAKRLCEYAGIEDYFEVYRENDIIDYFDVLDCETSEYMILYDEVYKMVDFEQVENDTIVVEHSNGNIDFDVTYHDGGASLKEVLEGALNEK